MFSLCSPNKGDFVNLEEKKFPRKLKGIAKGHEISGFGIVEYSVRSESGLSWCNGKWKEQACARKETCACMEPTRQDARANKKARQERKIQEAVKITDAPCIYGYVENIKLSQ